jgi:hypothetical protein
MAEPLRVLLGIKRFPLTPYFGIKRHFINIDSRSLRGYHGIQEASQGVVPDSTRTVTKNEVEVEVPWISDDYIWNMARLQRLATNKWKFTGMLDLDAVCGCFLSNRKV